jgi:hypothetical protein
VLDKHPDGERISDYLETEGYFIGHMIVPHKYNAKYQEKYRQAKYEYYLTRGLPIPPEYMPKEQQEGARDGEGAVNDKRTKGFEPQIAFRVGGQHGPEGKAATTEIEGGRENLSGRERMLKCIVLFGLANVSYVPDTAEGG